MLFMSSGLFVTPFRRSPQEIWSGPFLLSLAPMKSEKSAGLFKRFEVVPGNVKLNLGLEHKLLGQASVSSQPKILLPLLPFSSLVSPNRFLSFMDACTLLRIPARIYRGSGLLRPRRRNLPLSLSAKVWWVNALSNGAPWKFLQPREKRSVFRRGSAPS